MPLLVDKIVRTPKETRGFKQELMANDSNYLYRIENKQARSANRDNHYTYGHRMARGDSYTVLSLSVIQAVFGADPQAQRTMT